MTTIDRLWLEDNPIEARRLQDVYGIRDAQLSTRSDDVFQVCPGRIRQVILILHGVSCAALAGQGQAEHPVDHTGRADGRFESDPADGSETIRRGGNVSV